MFAVTEADYSICDCGCPESCHYAEPQHFQMTPSKDWPGYDEIHHCFQHWRCQCSGFHQNAEMTFRIQNGREWSRHYDPNLLIEPEGPMPNQYVLYEELAKRSDDLLARATWPENAPVHAQLHIAAALWRIAAELNLTHTENPR